MSEDKVVAQVTEIEDSAEPSVDPSIEREARQNGWVSKDQFKGDEKDWTDAETFVQKSRQLNPILKKSNESLKRELDSAKAELKELKLTTQEFAKEFAKMKDNAYKRAIAELKGQRREAIKGEDLDLADELEEKIDALKEEQTKAAPKEPAPGPVVDEEVLREFREWESENPWYNESTEPEMFDAAEGIALRLSRTNKDLKGRAFMERITEEVKKRFPDKFENRRRDKAPHEGSKSRGSSEGSKSYGALPAEAKKACDRYVKQGLMTREQYLETYEWE